MPDGSPFEGCPRTTLRRAIESATALDRPAHRDSKIEFYLFEQKRRRRRVDRDVGRRVVLRFFGQRPRRGGAQRDRGRAARDGRADRFGASRARRRAARDRRRARRSARGRRPRADAAHDRQARRGRLRAGCDVHAEAARGPRRAAACTPISGSARGSRRGDCALRGRRVAGARGRRRPRSAIRRSTPTSVLVAAWDAPIYTVWSERSANALVRVPPGQTPPRIEMRSPDPACNPYLALAVLIGAAADGIAQHTLARPGAGRIDLRS